MANKESEGKGDKETLRKHEDMAEPKERKEGKQRETEKEKKEKRDTERIKGGPRRKLIRKRDIRRESRTGEGERGRERGEL